MRAPPAAFMPRPRRVTAPGPELLDFSTAAVVGGSQPGAAATIALLDALALPDTGPTSLHSRRRELMSFARERTGEVMRCLTDLELRCPSDQASKRQQLVLAAGVLMTPLALPLLTRVAMSKLRPSATPIPLTSSTVAIQEARRKSQRSLDDFRTHTHATSLAEFDDQARVVAVLGVEALALDGDLGGADRANALDALVNFSLSPSATVRRFALFTLLRNPAFDRWSRAAVRRSPEEGRTMALALKGTARAVPGSSLRAPPT